MEDIALKLLWSIVVGTDSPFLSCVGLCVFFLRGLSVCGSSSLWRFGRWVHKCYILSLSGTGAPKRLFDYLLILERSSEFWGSLIRCSSSWARAQKRRFYYRKQCKFVDFGAVEQVLRFLNSRFLILSSCSETSIWLSVPKAFLLRSEMPMQRRWLRRKRQARRPPQDAHATCQTVNRMRSEVIWKIADATSGITMGVRAIGMNAAANANLGCENRSVVKPQLDAGAHLH